MTWAARGSPVASVRPCFSGLPPSSLSPSPLLHLELLKQILNGAPPTAAHLTDARLRSTQESWEGNVRLSVSTDGEQGTILTLQAIFCYLLGPSVSSTGTLPEGQVDSLLSIISSQRERFRTRNQELEAVSTTLLPVPRRLQI